MTTNRSKQSQHQAPAKAARAPRHLPSQALQRVSTRAVKSAQTPAGGGTSPGGGGTGPGGGGTTPGGGGPAGGTASPIMINSLRRRRA